MAWHPHQTTANVAFTTLQECTYLPYTAEQPHRCPPYLQFPSANLSWGLPPGPCLEAELWPRPLPLLSLYTICTAWRKAPNPYSAIKFSVTEPTLLPWNLIFHLDNFTRAVLPPSLPNYFSLCDTKGRCWHKDLGEDNLFGKLSEEI